MEEAYFYEISASVYKPTRCHDAEYCKLNNRAMETGHVRVT